MNLLLIKPEEYQAATHTAIITRLNVLQHLTLILKAKTGDTIKVGLLNGFKGTATIHALTEQQLGLSNILLNTQPPIKLPLTLVVGLPRPKVLKRLVKDATSLGISRLVLIHSYQVEKSYWQSPLLNHLTDYARLGLEQAGDTIAPEILTFNRFKPFVEDILPTWISEDCPAFVGHPQATATAPSAWNKPAIVLIGPEGGFIPYEIDLLTQNGCQSVSLGTRVLRTETAVSVLIGRMFDCI